MYIPPHNIGDLVKQLEGQSFTVIFGRIQHEMEVHRNLLYTKKSAMKAREAGCDYYLYQLRQIHSYIVSGKFEGGIDSNVLTAIDKLLKDCPKP